MEKINRNDPCPCGSGKKFKRCHLGREDELVLEKMKELQSELGGKLMELPEAGYGRTKEILTKVNIKELTGKPMGIKFIDLSQYLKLTGLEQEEPLQSSATQIVNLNKTQETDPDHIYIAITPGINDSSLIHQTAHVLSFLRDSSPLPGRYSEMSEQTGIPIEQLDHPKEFAYWLDYLSKEFKIELDAEDTIVSFLNEKGVLLTGEEITSKDPEELRSRSIEIFNLLRESTEEIDALIKNRDGYIGKPSASDES